VSGTTETQRVAEVIPRTLASKLILVKLITFLMACSPKSAVTGHPVCASVLNMGDVHDLILRDGKQAAIQSCLDRAVVETAAAYLSDEDSGLGFAYSGWAQCALPHARLANDATWGITSERVKLVVEPGRRSTFAPDGGHASEFVGVPFGSHARLILLYLQTEALRTSSREVELGGSMRGWLSRVGIPSGGKSDKSVRDQAERISRCKLTFDISIGSGTSGLIQQTIVDRAIFLDTADTGSRQGRLSLETAKLSEGFFEQLQRHAVPLEEAAIRALSNNAAALDVYLWLAHRLHSLPENRLVTWAALKGQFGGGFKKLYHFKSKFPAILAMAMATYPGAKVDVTDPGVILKRSPPPVAPKLFSLVRSPESAHKEMHRSPKSAVILTTRISGT
jgi:Plasmid encoded RepA protein